MTRNTKIVFAAAAIALTGTWAYAAKAVENDAHAIVNAKISLTQAIVAAEQHAQGLAARAEYERYKGKWIYDVEVVSGNKTFDVKVDGDQGNILLSKEDALDQDDNNDAQD